MASRCVPRRWCASGRRRQPRKRHQHGQRRVPAACAGPPGGRAAGRRARRGGAPRADRHRLAEDAARSGPRGLSRWSDRGANLGPGHGPGQAEHANELHGDSQSEAFDRLLPVFAWLAFEEGRDQDAARLTGYAGQAYSPIRADPLPPWGRLIQRMRTRLDGFSMARLQEEGNRWDEPRAMLAALARTAGVATSCGDLRRPRRSKRSKKKAIEAPRATEATEATEATQATPGDFSDRRDEDRSSGD